MALKVVESAEAERESASVDELAREAVVALRRLERAMLLEQFNGTEGQLTEYGYGAVCQRSAKFPTPDH